jgi:glutamate/tyrosine decarboxylase-like PLP-dependent enzyme
MENKHLAWFLGPKAENSDVFVNTFLSILQDYIHWRRNYYPSDPLVITKKMQREQEEEFDKLSQGVTEMMSQLRRNFPFYSPRYIGHMLSDISMPSMLGYFAGMLYNNNNVTPEAAPVSVEWEIEACNEVLKMLGYKPSPTPPKKEATKSDWAAYQKLLKEAFGWAHITSGGTVANIEAMWVARIIKYFPLAIRDAAIEKNYPLEIKLPNGTISDIKTVSAAALVSIKPNGAIYLYARLIEVIVKTESVSVAKAAEISQALFSKSPYSLGTHVGKVFSDFPPVIFTSGAAHYSIKKAADILGIGKDNVIIIKTDAQFRMDIHDLEFKIHKALKENKYPLAVVAVGSTTEQGAVDPVDEIVELRKKLEREKNISFWLHVDSAWGGYISSLFNIDGDELSAIIINKIARKLNISFANLEKQDVESQTYHMLEATPTKIFFKTDIPDYAKKVEIFKGRLEDSKSYIVKNEYESFLNECKKILLDFGQILYLSKETRLMDLIKKEDFEVSVADRAEDTSNFVRDTIDFSFKNYKKIKEIRWGGKPLVSSFLAFQYADSITIDPHKLGYVQYPCGLIAFKNDRVRHFIMQRAPYITSSGHNALIHNPPRHVKNIDFDKRTTQNLPYEDYQIGIDAFAPFILEGSRPGAAAAALWLSSKLIPLNRQNHGQIIKTSMIAARELFEWLFTWDKIVKKGLHIDALFEFKTFGAVPDTNVVVFAIKSKMDPTLEGMNQLTQTVYNYFAIQAELGENEHSYSQSFFISKTKMDNIYYKFEAFKPFFEGCGIQNAENDYLEKGLIILRATVMNPYITAIRQNTNQNLIKEFVWELHKTANESAQKQMKK